MKNFNKILDTSTRGNLQSVIRNLSNATAGLVTSATYLNRLLNTETGAFAGTLSNLNTFTGSLAGNSATLTHTISNVDSITGQLARLDLDSVMNQLRSATAKLDSAMTAINSTKGSVGALLYDREIYNNLNKTVVSLHTLTDDLRVHPKRYVNISVFGKKDKGNFIKSPLAEMTKPDTLYLSQDTIFVVQPK